MTTASRARKVKRKPEEVRVNWAGVREEYVTGDETYGQLANRLGLSVRTVESHASERNGSEPTWGELRTSFREDVARTFRMESAKKQVEDQLSVQEKQAQAARDLVDAALPVALDQLRNDKVGGYDAVKAIVAVLAAQRKIHGLDRAVRVELTGKDGEPIQHDVVHDAKLSDEQRALATRALEALFGETPDPE